LPAEKPHAALSNTTKENQWLQSQDCAIRGLLAYIRGQGQLRDTQIEAIETYLFLINDMVRAWRFLCQCQAYTR
jgi:hypothetical protein